MKKYCGNVQDNGEIGIEVSSLYPSSEWQRWTKAVDLDDKDSHCVFLSDNKPNSRPSYDAKSKRIYPTKYDV
jgi:hypothetical protein